MTRRPRQNGFPVSREKLRAEACRIGAAAEEAHEAFVAGMDAAKDRMTLFASLRIDADRIAQTINQAGGNASEGDPARVRYLGVTVTCTSGLANALRSWAAKASGIADEMEDGQ